MGTDIRRITSAAIEAALKGSDHRSRADSGDHRHGLTGMRAVAAGAALALAARIAVSRAQGAPLSKHLRGLSELPEAVGGLRDRLSDLPHATDAIRDRLAEQGWIDSDDDEEPVDEGEELVDGDEEDAPEDEVDEDELEGVADEAELEDEVDEDEIEGVADEAELEDEVDEDELEDEADEEPIDEDEELADEDEELADEAELEDEVDEDELEAEDAAEADVEDEAEEDADEGDGAVSDEQERTAGDSDAGLEVPSLGTESKRGGSVFGNGQVPDLDEVLSSRHDPPPVLARVEAGEANDERVHPAERPPKPPGTESDEASEETPSRRSGGRSRSRKSSSSGSRKKSSSGSRKKSSKSQKSKSGGR